MAAIKPIRRVVTGTDAQGRAKVLYDSAAPNANHRHNLYTSNPCVIAFSPHDAK